MKFRRYPDGLNRKQRLEIAKTFEFRFAQPDMKNLLRTNPFMYAEAVKWGLRALMDYARDEVLKVRRYPDGCYAVVKAGWRGPCAHDRPTARRRFRRSGFIARSSTGG